MSLFAELKRRNVFRMAALYVVSAWLLLQVADVLAGLFGLPDWSMRLVGFLLLLGFPLALVFSWVYELTPEGIKRESEVDRSTSIAPETGRRLDIAVIMVVVLGLVLVGIDRYLPRQNPIPATTPGQQASASEAALVNPNAESPDERASVAVLPFVNMSTDEENEFFADGISEELLNLLVKVEGLRVPSRTSSFQFKGQSLDLDAVAAKLDVRHVLEGSVRKAGNRVRITAQLIDAETDSHLWSETYDRELIDIFAVQDEIAGAIVEALEERLAIRDLAFEARGEFETTVPGAYEAFIRGREHWLDRNVSDAIAALQEAVTLDPAYARAWGTLATVYAAAGPYLAAPGDRFDADASDAARRALTIDPEQPDAHAALGMTYSNEFNWAQALAALERSEEHDPYNATTRHFSAALLSQVGQPEASLDASEQALALDSESGVIYSWRAFALYQLGRIEEARELAQQGADRGHAYGLLTSVLAAAEAGDESAFSDAWDRYVSTMLYRDPGRLPSAVEIWEARGNLKETEAVMKDFPLDATGIRAIGALVLGLPERALSDLRTLIEDQRHAHVLVFLYMPEFRSVRQLEGFKSLARTARLPEYWRGSSFPPMCRPLGEDDFACD